MATQYSFKRYEKKFVLTKKQFEKLLPVVEEHMKLDQYGLHTICNIYYDTDDYRLIRTSLDKPPYKEKFRLRCYGIAKDDTPIFAEIKKKFDNIVYKRRISARHDDIKLFLAGNNVKNENAQIQKEIHWFLHTNPIAPKVFIGYDRMAYYSEEDDTLRMTFDQNLRFRTDELDLLKGDRGELILEDNDVIMEVKIAKAVPLWLAKAFSELEIYHTSFSKYGTFYRKH